MSDERLPELFEELADLAAPDRDRRLADLAAREPDLAAELGRLLVAADPDVTPLERSPRLFPGADADDDSAVPVPDRIGPYRIERELGRGGMGRVFLAEQEGDGFRRRVALKVVAGLGASEESRRRLRAEWRILAGLEHPGIARFYDAGETRDGALYLALEFVDGDGLVAHAEARALGVTDRLRLFLQVLDAVAFAHSRGVVHRDLKPANILVGADGRVRLVDFGISKLLEADADASSLTRTGAQPLTPAYAAPEQILGQTAGPAADLYSLGVVLYELLSGRRPYRVTTGQPGEIERAVLDQQPEPPSTAARRAREGRDAEAPLPPPVPAPGLDRDLDAVCLKALRKEPSARYPSAGAFAEDLRRHLEGRPVTVRGSEVGYRLRRLVARHRAALVAAAAAATIAAVAAVLATRRPAPFVGPAVASSPGELPGVLPAELERRVLAAGATASLPPSEASIEQLERLFAAAPERVEAGAALALKLDGAGRPAEALAVVTRLRQIPGAAEDPRVDAVEALIANGLDEPQRALALATRGLAHAATRDDASLRSRLRATRGRVLSALGRHQEAEAELARSVDEAERAGDATALARNLNDLAIEVLQRGDFDRGEALLERALEVTRGDGADGGDGRRLRGGTMLANLGEVARLRGRPDLAEARFREAVAIYRELGRPRRVGADLVGLSQALRDQGRTLEAAAPLEEAIALLREAGDDTWVAVALFYRTDAAIDLGQLDGVEAAVEQIEGATLASGNPKGLALAEILRGRTAATSGDSSAGLRHLDEAVRLLEARGERDLAAAVELLAAEISLDAGRLEASAAHAERARATFQRGTRSEVATRAAALLARLDALAGRPADAARRLAELDPGAAAGPSVRERLAVRRARAALARAEGRISDARAELEAALAEARGAGRELEARAIVFELERIASGVPAASTDAGDSARAGSAATADSAWRAPRRVPTGGGTLARHAPAGWTGRGRHHSAARLARR